MDAEARRLAGQIDAARDDLERVRAALNTVLVGQAPLVTQVLVGVFAGGHLLLEGLPGLGKTQLAKALAHALGFELARVQCTPDLKPADITGSEVLARDGSGAQQLQFRQGPVFASMLLADEINRATPRTQAALLEAMQEHQVTAAGATHRLPEPFWLLATQNPIELEGTYPLPEAQLDRFMMKLPVSYPDADSLLALLDVSLDDEPAARLAAVIDPRRCASIVALARQVFIAEAVKRTAVGLVQATQPRGPEAHPRASEHLRYGASPRALQALLRGARVLALLDGRAHVASDDLRALALPVLRHRVLLTIESEVDGVDVDALLEDVVAERLSPP